MKHGTMSEAEAIEDTARATRQYARRQETWFSRDLRITWLSATSKLPERKACVLETILKS
jgi:tRNA dimethylallyltransferase